MKELILHGGKGTRLRPLTYEIPKGFIPICGSSTIERMIFPSDNRNISIVIPNGDTKIPAIVENKELPFQLIEADEFPMLSMVKTLEKHDEPIIVWWGDCLMSIDFSSMIKHHEETMAEATMALWHTTFLRELKHWGSVTLNSDGFTIDHPVPDTNLEGYIKAGAFIFNPGTASKIRRIADENWNMSKILNTMIGSSEFRGFCFKGYRVNINYGSDLLKAVRMVLTHENTGQIFVGRNVSILGHVEIGPNTSIEDNVTLENGVHISGSIILASSVIGANATVVDSIIGTSTYIPKNTFVRRKMIVKNISSDLSESDY